MKRRHFMQSLALTTGAAILSSKESVAQGESNPKGKPFQIGILMHEQEERPIDQTALGYDLIEIPVEIMVQPLQPQVVWEETLAMLKSWNLPPMKTSSHFLEGVLPVIGPVVDFELAQVWVDRALRRICRIGVRVAGVCGGFFRPPEGFPKARAVDQAIRVCNMIADYASRYGVTIALEPMADATTLFPSYLDGIEFAKRVGRPEIKMMLDTLYFERLK